MAEWSGSFKPLMLSLGSHQRRLATKALKLGVWDDTWIAAESIKL